MRTLFCLAVSLAALAAPQKSKALELRSQAMRQVQVGDWKKAESLAASAVEACRDENCPSGDLAVLEAEQAGILVHGGFPQAAIPLWRRALTHAGTGADATRLRASLLLGLGTAFDAAGQSARAIETWGKACPMLAGFEPEYASCRFNLAVANRDAAAAWSEMESLLPTLLTAESALTRAVALTQTAQAAASAAQPERAHLLAEQAEAVIAAELSPQHPALAGAYSAHALAAHAAGDRKLARRWDNKARALLQYNSSRSWTQATVPAKELGRDPR